MILLCYVGGFSMAQKNNKKDRKIFPRGSRDFNDGYYESIFWSRRDLIEERLWVINKVCEALKVGNTLKAACAMNKISVERWRAWEKEGLEQLKNETQDSPIDMAFIVGMQEYHEALFEQEVLLKLVEQSKKNWKVGMWLLERRFRESWQEYPEAPEVNRGKVITFAASIGSDGAIQRELSDADTLSLISEASGVDLGVDLNEWE
jgi:hypothetical protein